MAPQTASWIILFLPIFMAAGILFFGQRSKFVSSGLAIAGAGIACVLSWMLFIQGADLVVSTNWINLGRLDSPVPFTIPIGLSIDALSRPMLVIVTTIATLVFIYSTGYMAHEEGYCRYFAGLALFLFSMLGIVLANNFVMMFIFWELVGVSSYILIGHYYSRDSAGDAAKQAFIVNRIGDFGFMLGILVFWGVTGTVLFSELPGRLDAFHGASGWLAVACVLVFCGTVGKSAQFPLHVWLPNSMEGPTPVSSLLHAATMVAAGVYLLARIFPILQHSPDALTVIGWIGAITCFGAGLIGLQQNDIKRILAYSTISQLGYMVLGIGSAPVSGVAMFHLFTHASFKCLLFLCSGSVILGMHHEQDIWKMGGLKNKMPITFLMMTIGGLALMGCPGFSGGFSKDLIIEFAYTKGPGWFWLAAGGVFLTALYTTRMLWVTFLGAPRSDHAKEARESPAVMVIPLILLAIPSALAGWPFIQKHFFPIEEPVGVPGWVGFLIPGIFAAGVALAILIYRGAPQKDPVLIPFFANRLYLDDLYAQIVRFVQDGTAKASSWTDRWIIDGVGVNFSAKATWACGFALRFLQIGNIQAYAFFFGAGVIALLYVLISK
ncbi:MAG: NADH-quinone oxidoreductase subunit L [Terrimicrobiaceae bacterium]|nr:NADH-quinone oxidoreductase subunit L [Terrimicrobiaceae bacterium]